MTTSIKTFLKQYIKQCRYISQGDDPYCVPIAIANARIHLGLKPPDVESLGVKMDCRDDGPYQCVVDASMKEYLGKWIYRTRSFDKFMKTGGVVVIKGGDNPSDLHCCLCLVEKDRDTYTLINAFDSGPNVLTGYTQKEVKRLVPISKSRQNFWAFK